MNWNSLDFCKKWATTKFSIDIEGKEARGWIAEVYSGHFAIPDLGPIGANGLANERDFSAPVAAYEDDYGTDVEWKIYSRFCGKTFLYTQDHSPFNVVAWHGNYYPYKYDLKKFCTIVVLGTKLYLLVKKLPKTPP